ncbi:hypothetical protein [Marinobacterium mangrovicola]|uniref:Uncharacterized protein n=1 Tax=Marinobacterium mangrovicola TaxID=1476959 RepID=A0A4R1GJA3_9GAMM|nr:hypothetical protein [Marinobacterium mangrovicola]TCK08354.1 hypothetical protein CLV83_0433 [Marinobacterium mangrovicola]
MIYLPQVCCSLKLGEKSMIAATKLKQAQTLRWLVAEYEEAKEQHRGGVLALADKIFELDDDAGASAGCLIDP